MEADLVLSKTFGYIKDKEYLNDLIATYKNFLSNKDEIFNKTKEFEDENCELKKRLVVLQNSEEKLKQREIKWIENLKQKPTQNPISTTDLFTETCKLLGYYIEEEAWDKEQQAQYVKCSFSEECFVRFLMFPSEHKELLAITPIHPNFEDIKIFFRKTQDSAGLLSTLLKYFKSFNNQTS